MVPEVTSGTDLTKYKFVIMGLRYRQNVKGGCYFVTTSVAGFVKVFNDPQCSNIIVDSLKYCKQKFGFVLNAYVIMPDHLHMILTINTNSRISDIMRDFKKYTSVAIKRYLLDGNDDKIYFQLLKQVPKSTKRSFKLWQDRFDDVSLYSEKTFLTKMSYIIFNPVRAGLVTKPDEWPYLYCQSFDDSSQK